MHVRYNDAWSEIPAAKQRQPGQPREECMVDLVYRPVRHPAAVTERARAEAALRISNWRLGGERARLAAAVEAGRCARQALRRCNETLEAHLRTRQPQPYQRTPACFSNCPVSYSGSPMMPVYEPAMRAMCAAARPCTA